MSYIAGVCFKIKFNDSTFMQGMINGKFHNTESLSKAMLCITPFSADMALTSLCY